MQWKLCNIINIGNHIKLCFNPPYIKEFQNYKKVDIRDFTVYKHWVISKF